MSEKDILGVRHAHVRKIVVTTVRKDGTKTVRTELEMFQIDRNVAPAGSLNHESRRSFSRWLRELMTRVMATGLYHWMLTVFESAKFALRLFFS